jgi:UDP-N-acetylmuramyl pentapeptide phosphotransferase/UDP-N-acetylglucosamine-1-phosphate transferase
MDETARVAAAMRLLAEVDYSIIIFINHIPVTQLTRCMHRRKQRRKKRRAKRVRKIRRNQRRKKIHQKRRNPRKAANIPTHHPAVILINAFFSHSFFPIACCSSLHYLI